MLLDNLTSEEFELAKGIINPKTGWLRASKPSVPKKIQVDAPDAFFGKKWIYKNQADANKGRTAYIWRMVAFFISSNSQHQCMPCTCDFWLEGTVKEAQEEAKRLDKIVDKIVDNVPAENRYGVNRWSKALGYTN